MYDHNTKIDEFLNATAAKQPTPGGGSVTALVGKVNHHLLSDLAVCCELAMATVRSAGYNVRVNLPELDDPRDRERLQSEADHLLGRATHVVARAVGRIWARHARQGA